MADLSVSLPGLEISNPLLLASGILGGNAQALQLAAQSGAAGLVSKSIGPEPREIYPGPVCYAAMDNVVLNAMGLPNPGIDEFIAMLEHTEFSIPLMVSIFATDAAGFADLAAKLAQHGVSALELNLSCPHSAPGSRDLILGQQADLVHEVVAAVRAAVDIPIYAKLTPNTTRLIDEAAAAITAGANGLVVINNVAALDCDPFSR